MIIRYFPSIHGSLGVMTCSLAGLNAKHANNKYVCYSRVGYFKPTAAVRIVKFYDCPQEPCNMG